LPCSADEPVDTRRKAHDPEVLCRKEVVLSGLVYYPQLPVRLGVSIGPDVVDLPVLQAGRILANFDANSVTKALQRRCLHGMTWR
jgi:hypothetical protein